MSIDYNKHVSELIDTKVINSDEVFLFDGMPLEEELNRLFTFYHGELKKNIGCDIEPSFLFIANDRSVNAFAKKDKGICVIGINLGTIHHLYNFFKVNNGLKSNLLKRFPSFSATDLLFESAMHFTFYHELGHLIQGSTFLKYNLSEDNQNRYTLKKHLLEFDADEFSSILIASYIAEFTIKKLGQKINQNDLEDILIIICTSILFYLLSFPSSKIEMYYNECTHPHPVIRIVNITSVIINHCLATLTQHNVNISIDPSKIIKHTIELAIQIHDKMFDENRLKIILENNETYAEDVENHLKYIRNMKRGDNSMATPKWNLYVYSLIEGRNMNK